MEAWAGFSPVKGFKLETNVTTFESGSPQNASANSLERLVARAGVVGLERVDCLGSYQGGGVLSLELVWVWEVRAWEVKVKTLGFLSEPLVPSMETEYTISVPFFCYYHLLCGWLRS